MPKSAERKRRGRSLEYLRKGMRSELSTKQIAIMLLSERMRKPTTMLGLISASESGRQIKNT